MIHRYDHQVDSSVLPDEFTCPYYYIPHPLVVEAAEEVRRHVRLSESGKMLGVLVVVDEEDEVGFLAAYSGEMEDDDGYFVPPVVDYLQPDGYFKIRENEIVALSGVIDEKENGEELRRMRVELAEKRSKMAERLAELKCRMKQRKEARDNSRAAGISEEDEKALIRQSQFDKAEYKRVERRENDEVSKLSVAIDEKEGELRRLKLKRKVESSNLQQWLFDQYQMRNARGEVRTLNDIFNEERLVVPPSGAGDCCAPRMLQYAYDHSLKPKVMGEFWVGPSPKNTLRRDGQFYPSCQRKCRPILRHMLGGLQVEKNPLEGMQVKGLKVVYEDQWIVVVDKPSGLQSVPGLVTADSVEERLRQSRGGYVAMAHRLDQPTSGLIVAAKDKDVLAALHQQFENRRVKKKYVALLEHRPVKNSGEIRLPIGVDEDDNMRRRVDYVDGKPAMTHYRVLGDEAGGCVRVEFVPETGRTHQLRVHSAHEDGLDSPIVGDMLYGKCGQRLCLHASFIQFEHPVGGETMCFESEPEF